MKRQIFGILTVAGVLSLAGVTPVGAQQDPGMVKVPFPFIVNGSLVPAGTYRIEPQASDESVVLLTSLDNRIGMAVLTDWGSSVREQSAASLAFKKFGTRYFLAEIRLPGANAREIPLSPKIIASELAKVEAAADHSANGSQH